MLGILGANDVSSLFLQAPTAGVVLVDLVRALAASQHDLLGVDDDDEVAAIQMGVKMALFLPRRMFAICTARRPSTSPSASITCQLRRFR